MVHISAAVAALVVAALLGWTVVDWRTDVPQAVAPTPGVTHRGPADATPAGPETDSQLIARSHLQEVRPAPMAPPASAAAAGKPLAKEGAPPPGGELVERWLDNKPSDYPVLQGRGNVTGISPTLPDPRAKVLIQTGGREWRRVQTEQVLYGGAWVMFGMLLALSVFLLLRGRVGVRGGLSGERVERFNAFERANHWMTAGSFVVLALTGLVLLYGDAIIKPWLGATPFRWLAAGSAYAHVAFSAAFVLGLVIMVAMWARQNLLNRLDWIWLKRGGGLLVEPKGEPPPAERFNAGQKLLFWTVVATGFLMLASGVSLMFPFFWLGVNALQWMMVVHAAVGLIMIAVIFAHIYIGTVGMEGAVGAMWSGEVDRRWLEEHHSRWSEGLGARPEPGRRHAPAE